MGASNFGYGEIWAVNEAERLNQQFLFENRTKIDSRREMGQFFTDFNIAEELIRYGMSLTNDNDIICLEPAFGAGSFFSAIEKNHRQKVSKVIGYEIDLDLFDKMKEIWSETNRLYLNHKDFFEEIVTEKVDFLITNPPYVRHQYINLDRKKKYGDLVYKETGIRLSGLSGLYCYYMLHAQKWLKPGAIAGWLLPSEFMDVNYGEQVKDFLLNNVTLIRIHRYDPNNVIFDDAKVTSAVVWYKNETPRDDYEVEFSYGGTHEKPLISKKVKKSALSLERKWTRFPQKEVRIENNSQTIGDYFDVKRGLATGDNDFFIVDEETIQSNSFKMQYLQPILPSPRHLKVNEIQSDERGIPTNVNSLFLINCRMNENEIQEIYPELWEYLKVGIESTSMKYLCKSRKKWYFQEQRLPAPILCTYMGRGKKSIRFIRNKSKAIATNSYLMLYPKADLVEEISDNPQIIDEMCGYLNDIATETIEEEGRVYGGGLKKIEPKELKNAKFYRRF